MHSWQNGTKCRDGVNVLWCRSHLVWLIFEGSRLFTFGKLFCDFFFRNSKREGRWERKASGRCIVCKV